MDRIYGILGIAAKAGKLMSGFDSLQEGISKKQVNLVIVAQDASEKTKKEMQFICHKYGVPCIIFGNIQENSHAIGKNNRAIIGICDSGLANKFLELISD